MGDGESPDVAALGRQLASTDPEQRALAAELLSRAGEDASTAAVSLVTACGDADERVREWVVAVLEDLGAPPKESIDGLSRLATATDPLTAYWATTLLGRSGEDAASAVPLLAACLESRADLSVRERAAWALGKIGRPAASARAALERVAGAADERLARLARESLESIGPS